MVVICTVQTLSKGQVMKRWDLILVGSFVLAVAGMSRVAVGDTEPAAAEVAEAAAVEASEDAVMDAADEAAQLPREVDVTIQGVIEELEAADEEIPAAAAGADAQAEGQADADVSMQDAKARLMSDASSSIFTSSLMPQRS